MYLGLIGFFTAILAGMGMGGGVLLIPCLTLLLGYPQMQAQHLSLITYVPMAAAALVVHARKRNVVFKQLLPVLISGLAGAAGGALLSSVIDGAVLRKIYGFFLLFFGVMQMFSAVKRYRAATEEKKNEK
ncbi:MAG: TSUP family transporter [Clostridiales bacterium]|nr:TSUP family transporter [Clostridiales bacterium]